MRRAVVAALLVCVFMMMWTTTGCTDKKPTADTIVADTVVDTSAVDTMDQLISEQPMPKAADELFDDFIFNFAANKKLQLKRIAFPLKVVNGKKISYIEKSKWRTEHFFMNQGYYTLIFDNRKQMNLVKDTSVNNVIVEKINLRQAKVKKYIFQRQKGNWMLTEIQKDAMYQNTNASFLTFYQKFVTDSAFQLQSLSNPVSFSGPDPDDDFNNMTGEIAPETWPAFAPELPADFIYNIVYGQKYMQGNQKIFVMRGIANGMEMTLTFKRKSGRWMLTNLAE